MNIQQQHGLTFSHGVMLGTILPLLVLAFLTLIVKADSYFTASLGTAKHYQPTNVDNLYFQSRYDHTVDTRSNAYSLGLGWKFDHGIRAELGISRLGGYHVFGGFTGPDSNYNPQTSNGCNGKCNPTQWGYADMDIPWLVSFELFKDFQLTKDFSLFAGVGMEYHKIDFHWYTVSGKNDSQTPDPYDHNYLDRGGNRGGMGYGSLYSAGLSYKDLYFAYTNYKSAGKIVHYDGQPDGGPTEGVKSWMVGYRCAL